MEWNGNVLLCSKSSQQVLLHSQQEMHAGQTLVYWGQEIARRT